MSVMTHFAPTVCGCVVTPIITRVALCVITFFGYCTYIINLSIRFSFQKLYVQAIGSELFCINCFAALKLKQHLFVYHRVVEKF